MMTEADFQNKAYEILNKLLPTFNKVDIKCQGSFSIKFGHHNVIINGKEPSKYANRGIYDLLVFINNEPMILLELKKPGSTITTEDIKQGISYARLTDKITPLTIITNGVDHEIYSTIDNTPFFVSEIDENFIKTVKSNLTIASDDLRSSIETLIQNDQQVLFEIVNGISSESFESMIGSVNQFERPIIENFCITRTIFDEFTLKIQDKKLVFLTGDAFVGKTTLLYQFFKREKEIGNATLYVDCNDTFYSIFKKLSHFLSGTLNYQIVESKVNEWLISNLNKQSTKKINIIFDNLRYQSDPDILKHITELKDIFKFSEQRIIICADTSSHKLLTEQSGRKTLTTLGKFFATQKLGNFTTDEYLKANDLIIEKFNLGILLGGVYAREFRTPRIWRILINDSLLEKQQENEYGLIDSVPNISFLDVFKKSIQFDHQTVTDFRKFAKAFVESIPSLKKKPELQLMAYNLGIIEEDFAIAQLGNDLISRLILAGFVERRPVKNYQWVFVPKLPELIAGYSIDYLKEKFFPLFETDLKQFYSDFLDTCAYFPYGEMVAAKVLFDLGNSDKVELFSDIINNLIKDEPNIEVSTGEKTLGLYYEGIGDITIESGKGIEDKFIGNAFPFLVLAHLTYMNFGDGSTDPHLIRFEVIRKIGNSKYTQRRNDHVFFHNGIITLESEELGDFIKTNIGIIEPIVLSMKMNLLNYPQHYQKLYESAKTNKLFPLLHRMYIAAKNTQEFGSQEVIKLCKKIEQEYESDIMFRMFAYADLGLKTSRSEFRRLYKHYKKIGKK